MDKKISIIIPIYNSEKYLSKCLDSVINQTYNNLEIILVNDGSIDNSINVMKEYARKNKRIIIIDKKNTGVSSTRNEGIKKATGDYIMFLDSDDWLEIDAVERMYNILCDTGVDAVRCNYKIVKNNQIIEHGNVNNEIMNRVIDNPKEIINNFFTKPKTLPCYSVLFLFDSKYKVYFDEKIGFMEDVIFYNDLLSSIGSIYLINDELYNYYYNDTSRVNATSNYQKNILEICKVNEILRKKNPEFAKKINTKHLSIILSYLSKSVNNHVQNYNLLYNTILENKLYQLMINNYDSKGWGLVTKIKLLLLKFNLKKILKMVIFIKK